MEIPRIHTVLPFVVRNSDHQSDSRLIHLRG